MKKIFCSFVLLSFLLSISCNTDNNSVVSDVENKNRASVLDENKVLLLMVDYTKSIFEGGKEFVFPERTNSFTISTTYVEPSDFGSLHLYYYELQEKLFYGTIHWMGRGKMYYPPEIDLPDNFAKLNANLDMPEVNKFKRIKYGYGQDSPTPKQCKEVWDAISNLAIVKSYMLSNPDGKINLFLYTPSVGAGNPEDWDWIIILKN